ncbi:MAG: hypothetical protein M1296_05020 [Chloroflexi bacterium]|nr:hypothetical protein [Chloroflexota bacterium]
MGKVIQWFLMAVGAGTLLSVGAAIAYLVVDDYLVRRRQKELEAAEAANATPTPSS